jgi:predicted transcriptional regulator
MDPNRSKAEEIEIALQNYTTVKKVTNPVKPINPRINLSKRKYQKNVIWRRNKVKELLFKGYDQQEITSMLHVSQPTISRDTALLHNQREKEISDYGKLLFENHFDIVNGSTELLKQAWKTLDNPKTDNKTRIKTMDFIKDIYDKRIELFQSLPYMVKIY